VQIGILLFKSKFWGLILISIEEVRELY
jgi:hypothetical protein